MSLNVIGKSNLGRSLITLLHSPYSLMVLSELGDRRKEINGWYFFPIFNNLDPTIVSSPKSLMPKALTAIWSIAGTAFLTLMISLGRIGIIQFGRAFRVPFSESVNHQPPKTCTVLNRGLMNIESTSNPPNILFCTWC